MACVALLGFAGKANAQTTPRFGLKAGLTYTTLGSATLGGISVNYDYRPGFQGGFFAELPVSETVSVNPQLLFTQKGANFPSNVGGVKIDGSVQLNYIDFPVLLGVKANPQLSFYAGPQVSFLLSHKTTATVNGVTNTSTSKDDVESTLIGGNLGAGYQFTDSFGVNVNYIFDFGRAAKGASDNGEKNSGFILSLSHRF